MNKSEAHAVIGSHSDWEQEQIEEEVEELLFKLKSYFLTNPIIVPLFRSRIAKLRSIQEAILALGLGPVTSDEPSVLVAKVPESHNIEEFLRNYEQLKNELKLRLSATTIASEIAHCAELLCELELDYMDKFWNLTEKSGVPDEAVKAADVPDFGDFIFELRKNSSLAEQMIMKERARIQVLLKKNN